eukprot:2565843-Rhodomonas_salina.1
MMWWWEGGVEWTQREKLEGDQEEENWKIERGGAGARQTEKVPRPGREGEEERGGGGRFSRCSSRDRECSVRGCEQRTSSTAAQQPWTLDPRHTLLTELSVRCLRAEVGIGTGGGELFTS